MCLNGIIYNYSHLYDTQKTTHFWCKTLYAQGIARNIFQNDFYNNWLDWPLFRVYCFPCVSLVTAPTVVHARSCLKSIFLFWYNSSKLFFFNASHWDCSIREWCIVTITADFLIHIYRTALLFITNKLDKTNQTAPYSMYWLPAIIYLLNKPTIKCYH